MDEQRRLAAKRSNLWLRARLIQAIRHFFIDNDYLEVETPHLIPAPAPEVHIDAIRAGGAFLHTSPELYMKRLVSAGYSRIFQICRCFREGERGERHLAEFTLLEWYREGIDYVELMDECEEMVLSVSQELGFGEKIHFQGKAIDLKRPWERMSVKEAYERYASMPMERALALKRFDEVMVLEIEPHLGIPKPTFLYDYPAELAALARLKENDPGLAERFEIYVAGLELANAFSELTDVSEQEARFERDRSERKRLGKTVYPLPKRFLEALVHMPNSVGIAFGMDRLAMVFSNAGKIDEVISFSPEDL
ncbi:MAG: EF-P lysine aminoacylase GenX [Deltaproteobacteria bacterium]|nr:MAG: EF-P lysine aminoacylase GenX [Deltaproteobacteria bacterium]